MDPEKRLAERCARGERLACKELYDSFAGRLLALSARYVGSRDAAEDILQDSFIRIFNSIGGFKYRGRGSLYAWLSRIVVNRSLDMLREQKRLGTVSIEQTRMDRDGDITENEVDMIPEEVLAGMVEGLPEGYRTVFNMFAVDGYSHKEIGRMLGIKEKSSSSQYFRARALLAERIKEYIRNNG